MALDHEKEKDEQQGSVKLAEQHDVGERDESERKTPIDLGTNCDLCVENGNVWVQMKRRKKTFQLLELYRAHYRAQTKGPDESRLHITLMAKCPLRARSGHMSCGMR
jgi:hypothetical protein